MKLLYLFLGFIFMFAFISGLAGLLCKDTSTKTCFKCGSNILGNRAKKLPVTTYQKERYFCPSCWLEFSWKTRQY